MDKNNSEYLVQYKKRIANYNKNVAEQKFKIQEFKSRVYPELCKFSSEIKIDTFYNQKLIMDVIKEKGY